MKAAVPLVLALVTIFGVCQIEQNSAGWAPIGAFPRFNGQCLHLCRLLQHACASMIWCKLTSDDEDLIARRQASVPGWGTRGTILVLGDDLTLLRPVSADCWDATQPNTCTKR